VNVLRAKRSKKIILGAVTAGVAAIGLAATIPAHADEPENAQMATLVTGSGTTLDAAREDALRQCTNLGGRSGREDGTQNPDGTYIVSVHCMVS
jgi:hypothetical protein